MPSQKNIIETSLDGIDVILVKSHSFDIPELDEDFTEGLPYYDAD